MEIYYIQNVTIKLQNIKFIKNLYLVLLFINESSKNLPLLLNVNEEFEKISKNSFRKITFCLFN